MDFAFFFPDTYLFRCCFVFGAVRKSINFKTLSHLHPSLTVKKGKSETTELLSTASRAKPTPITLSPFFGCCCILAINFVYYVYSKLLPSCDVCFSLFAFLKSLMRLKCLWMSRNACVCVCRLVFWPHQRKAKEASSCSVYLMTFAAVPYDEGLRPAIKSKSFNNKGISLSHHAPHSTAI